MKRVLSIHSTVTIGLVGNSVVGPVLTALGLQPLLVHTVMLAAHPGYGRRIGGAVPDPIVEDILTGLNKITDIDGIGGVVSGYLGSVSQTAAIAAFIDSWRDKGSGLYVLDPVLGDRGRLYVPEALARAMGAHLLPRADIITPNGFELGYLADMPVTDRASAQNAANRLMDRHGLSAIITTGIDDGSHGIGDLLVTRGDSVWSGAGFNGRNVAGGGDLLTAVFAGQMAHGVPLAEAFLRASQTAQRLIAASPSPRDLALYENLDQVAVLVN